MTYGIASEATKLDLGDLAQYVEVDDDTIKVDIVFGGALDETFNVDRDHAHEVVARLGVMFESSAEQAAMIPGESWEIVAYDLWGETVARREYVCPEPVWQNETLAEYPSWWRRFKNRWNQFDALLRGDNLPFE